MKTTYLKYTFKADHSAESAQRALAEGGAQGLIVRIDKDGGQTHVYVATQDPGAAPQPASAGKKETAGPKGIEVTESDLTKF